jgi:hypothetical protein
MTTYNAVLGGSALAILILTIWYDVKSNSKKDKAK